MTDATPAAPAAETGPTEGTVRDTARALREKGMHFESALLVVLLTNRVILARENAALLAQLAEAREDARKSKEELHFTNFAYEQYREEAARLGMFAGWVGTWIDRPFASIEPTEMERLFEKARALLAELDGDIDAAIRVQKDAPHDR